MVRASSASGVAIGGAAVAVVAILAALGVAVPASAQGPVPGGPEGIHLAWRPDLDEYAVRFHSALPLQDFQATWRDANGTDHEAPIIVTVPNYGGGSSVYGFRFPATAEGYSVNDRDFTIRGTPPAGNETVRVAWVADIGMTSDTTAVLTAARSAGVGAILAGGDLSYADGDAAAWDAWFTFMEPYISDVPFIPARGNHEGRCLPVAAQNFLQDCSTDEQMFLNRFDLPLAGLYYATEWGPLRIIVLDSEAYYPRGDPLDRTRNVLPAEQRSFLADALRAPDGVWEIVMFHRPMYSSSGAHGSEFVIRDDLRPVLEAGGADLVLNGHDHDYERTHSLLGDRPNTTGNVTHPDAGVVYVVSGGGGQSLYDSWQPESDWSAFRAAEFHFLLIEADAQRLVVTATMPNGTVLDQFTLQRPTPTPAAVEVGENPVPLSPLVALGALAVALVLRRR